MQEKDDQSLLREFVDHKSEEAFATLVTRHVDKVYSAALRQTRDVHAAEEITQAVFVLLAKKGRQLGREVVLSGWLYKAAHLTAVSFMRSEIRRGRREQEVYMQGNLNEPESTDWQQIAPELDAAMAGLGEQDRRAVVLRYFDRRSMEEVGTILGASAEAAKKRVNRAVEKLRVILTRRGVVVPAAVLTGLISTNAVQAAPVGLAKAISAGALVHGAAGTGFVMTFLKGLAKPFVSSWAGLFVAPVLSGIYVLRAEVEHAKSPRERQFLVRMIWLRFGMAFLMLACAGAAMTLPIAREPRVIVFGFAGLCLFGAIEGGARIVYFHRRRREIQMEDGTWEAYQADGKSGPAELLAGLSETSSKRHRYGAVAAVFGVIGCLVIAATLMMRLVAGGHPIGALLVLLWSGFAIYRWVRMWKQSARFVFDRELITPVKVVLCFGVMTLLLFNAAWAKGRLPQSDAEAIGFNVAVVVAYAALAGIFGRAHRRAALAPGSV